MARIETDAEKFNGIYLKLTGDVSDGVVSDMRVFWVSEVEGVADIELTDAIGERDAKIFIHHLLDLADGADEPCAFTIAKANREWRDGESA